MSQEDNVRDRSAAPSFVASYLSNEWGDVLLPQGHALFGSNFNHDALDEDRVSRERIDVLHSLYRPGAFYREAAEQIGRWCDKADLRPQRVIDVSARRAG